VHPKPNALFPRRRTAFLPFRHNKRHILHLKRSKREFLREEVRQIPQPAGDVDEVPVLGEGVQGISGLEEGELGESKLGHGECKVQRCGREVGGGVGLEVLGDGVEGFEGAGGAGGEAVGCLGEKMR